MTMTTKKDKDIYITLQEGLHMQRLVTFERESDMGEHLQFLQCVVCHAIEKHCQRHNGPRVLSL